MTVLLSVRSSRAMYSISFIRRDILSASERIYPNHFPCSATVSSGFEVITSRFADMTASGVFSSWEALEKNTLCLFHVSSIGVTAHFDSSTDNKNSTTSDSANMPASITSRRVIVDTSFVRSSRTITLPLSLSRIS